MDLTKLHWKSETETHGPAPKHKPGEKFLRGPIPWLWLAAAGNLPGKCLHVAIAVWFEVGLRRGEASRVKLSPKRLRELGSSRHSTYRALAEMENANLISVERSRGRSPFVHLLDPSPPAAESERTT